MLIRAILAKWAYDSGLRKIVEGDLSDERIQALNSQGYNVYYLPNYPSQYDPTSTVDGSHIDTFEWVFVDFDLKQGTYPTKDAFLESLSSAPYPSSIVDSGNGVHVFWRVNGLDAMSYLRFQRRLMRLLKTDEAVAKIYQLMRVPGTLNVKTQGAFIPCETLYEGPDTYTCEELDALLPPIRLEDEEYCQTHYNLTYSIPSEIKVDDKIPNKFKDLIRNNAEAKEIWAGGVDDRSKADYRLGHIMWGNDFTRDEALSVLVNSAKALQRAPKHRVNYATGIIDKIWTFEEAPKDEGLNLSSTVREILSRSGDTLKGTRLPCHRYLDATAYGFRLGQVIGLVAGSGVGKTAMALNMFEGFVQNNPDLDHFFIPLEQPANEIADRWKTMCGDNTHLHDKVHVISNYDEQGAFRHLSFDDIRQYLLKFQKQTNRRVGCVVIDHIGALKKKNAKGENQDLMDICHEMKAFAVETNTLLVMQSQAPREKAGIGDLELNKDAAYGTVYFESYCDYLITIWQPLKRVYSRAKCPTVTAFKFCKIRHKKQHLDEIKEDVRYLLYFDPETEHLRELTQTEETSFDFFNKQALSERKQDRKTDGVIYTRIDWTKDLHKI